MPVIARIDWVISQLSLGRKVHIALSTARDYNKTKCKVVVYPLPEGSPSTFTKNLLYMQLVWLRDLTLNSVSVDRGHKHSKGTSEIQIWLSEHTHNEAFDTGQYEVPSRPIGPSYPTYSEAIQMGSILARAQCPPPSPSWFPARPPGHWADALTCPDAAARTTGRSDAGETHCTDEELCAMLSCLEGQTCDALARLIFLGLWATLKGC